MIQLACVLNSSILDPFLIKYFQTQSGNGGIGLAVASGISESLMVTVGIVLMPRGVFNRALAKTFVLAALSGSAMVGSALALRVLPSLLAAPISVVAYALALYVTGAVSKEEVASLSDMVRRKLTRNRAPAS
jgi:hypothetical protein